MDSVLATLAGLPSGLLYPILLAVAAVENFVPPFPADVVVAFGAFVAAQGRHLMALVFVFSWIGNVGGALSVYFLAQRYGVRLQRAIGGDRAPERMERFEAMFARFGLPALFVARFVPGVRALVPVAAGALKLPLPTTAIMLMGAAAIWYGIIIFVAFRVGTDWTQLRDGIGEFSKTLGVAAMAILAAGLVIWAIVRRRQSSR